jgi:hypothetical protein
MRARRPGIDVGRERSDIPAHHVGLLTLNGLLQIVRTRKVPAMQERFSGRTARLFYVAAPTAGVVMLRDVNDLRWLRTSRARHTRTESWGSHPVRAHLAGAGAGVLGADRSARRRIRPYAAHRRRRVGSGDSSTESGSGTPRRLEKSRGRSSRRLPE